MKVLITGCHKSQECTIEIENVGQDTFTYGGCVFKLSKQKDGSRIVRLNRPLRYASKHEGHVFYVYHILCDYGTHYIGATNNMEERSEKHRQAFGRGVEITVLHTTDAQNASRLEQEEIDKHIAKYGRHMMRNEVFKSGYHAFPSFKSLRNAHLK